MSSRRRCGRGSLHPCDHLIAIPEIELDGSCLTTSEVGFDRQDVPEPLDGDVVHGAHVDGAELQDDLPSPGAARGTHALVEMW